MNKSAGTGADIIAGNTVGVEDSRGTASLHCVAAQLRSVEELR